MSLPNNNRLLGSDQEAKALRLGLPYDVSTATFEQQLSAWLDNPQGRMLLQIYSTLANDPDVTAAFAKMPMCLDRDAASRDRFWNLPEAANLVIFGRGGDRNLCSDHTFIQLIRANNFVDFLLGIYSASLIHVPVH